MSDEEFRCPLMGQHPYRQGPAGAGKEDEPEKNEPEKKDQGISTGGAIAGILVMGLAGFGIGTYTGVYMERVESGLTQRENASQMVAYTHKSFDSPNVLCVRVGEEEDNILVQDDTNLSMYRSLEQHLTGFKNNYDRQIAKAKILRWMRWDPKKRICRPKYFGKVPADNPLQGEHE